MLSPAAFSPEHNHHHNLHLPPPSSGQLCHVQCNNCNTVLAVNVPGSSMSLATVTVRCGQCTKLLSVNVRAHLPPPAATAAANQPRVGHNLSSHGQNIKEEVMNQPVPNPSGPVQVDELLEPPVVNRPLEKRQGVPSVYNRFIKEEVEGMKAENADTGHREAAKSWEHVSSNQEPQVSDSSSMESDPPCIALNLTHPCFNWASWVSRVSNKHV